MWRVFTSEENTNMKNIFLLLVFALFLPISMYAQELECNIQINSDQVQTQEQQVFTDMQNAIQQFMNTTKWTDEEFEEHERIKCDILITLNKGTSITNFGAVVQIKSIRPVYGTTYESPVINFFDNKWAFTYAPSQPLIFSENTYSTELTSLLAYYAYMIIAIDFDSFSEKGGSPYYQRALNILNNSQTGGRPGWSAIGGDTRDRYWLITNLNSPQFEDFRKAIYKYHRLALDTMTENPEEARKEVLEVLQLIKKVRDQQPTSVTINAFFDAKSVEIANLFTQADEATRAKAVELLVQLDPANSAMYRKLNK